jgi:peroxisomal 2,4-dienoyl-CoA reductase
VHLGANACIVGQNAEKAERVPSDIATGRNGAKVLGYNGVDFINFNLEVAAQKCVEELGNIDFVM